MKKLLTAFISNFGNVPVLQWKLLNDGTLKAYFVKNGKEWEAIFKVNGTLVKAEAVE